MRLAILVFFYRLLAWFDFKECPKESMGYTCRHRVYDNGKKECGN